MKEKFKAGFDKVNFDKVKFNKENINKEKVKGLFDFKTDMSASEVKTVTGKIIGGQHTSIGTKINKFAKFLEILAVIGFVLGAICAVFSLIAGILGTLADTHVGVVAAICLGIGVGVMILSLFNMMSTWVLYALGQSVNNLSAIRKGLENGAVMPGGENVSAVDVSVAYNPDELPEL